jgi:hypothetical protein
MQSISNNIEFYSYRGMLIYSYSITENEKCVLIKIKDKKVDLFQSYSFFISHFDLTRFEQCENQLNKLRKYKNEISTRKSCFFF